MSMIVQNDISLREYNTFGIDVRAAHFVALQNEEEAEELVASGMLKEMPYYVIGGGSNLVFASDFKGTILKMANQGVRVIDGGRWDIDEPQVAVEAQAGMEWDLFVRECVRNGWHGLENLVAIPGTVGAAPIQNVGAYGMEAKDAIVEVRAVDLNTGKRVSFSNEECHFAYRHSWFKEKGNAHYIVVSVVFRLSRVFTPNLSYKALASALDGESITPQRMVDAITDIRWSKLPRPEETGSAGSFFKNPIVTASKHEALLQEFPNMVAYPVDDGHYKLAAGWLIEHAGWKGKSLGRAGVYEKQSLVLVNRGGATGADILRLANAIVADVEAKYGVTMEKEAIILT